MESTDNSLSHRQVDVVRRNLLTVFRFAVKALIDKACFCSIDDGCEEFINFCATMEHILQHRLRPSKMWYLGDDRSHFWFYIKAACHRHDLRGCITNIDNIENIKSPVAKGRAFVRCALMEKRLSEYIGEALKQSNITRRFYKPGAIMLGEEATELCGVLLGLNSIDFGFCVKGENYDTVECPLAISYTPFMKFKQSQESLHSDQEEMRELSCGSSLASEDGHDGHDGPSSESWSDRFNALHKRYMRVLEQKSFLEEVTSSQEKALQAAAGMQQEVCLMQREAALQKRQYEGVILELQAQVARMKSINESLQQQLVAARNARFPLTEMERRGGEATRFAAAMGYKQDSDRQSLTSSYDRSSVNRAGDTRSLTSAVSEFSVDVASTGMGQTPAAGRQGEDSHSMVPLTGSLGDLHLDLEPGVSQAISPVESSRTISYPEQATPVVSVSSGAYNIAFVESSEINGNGEGNNIHVRDSALHDIPSTQVSLVDAQDHAQDSTVEASSQPHTQSSGRLSDEKHSSGSHAPENTSSPQQESTGDHQASNDQLEDHTARKEVVAVTVDQAHTLAADRQEANIMHSSSSSQEEVVLLQPSQDLGHSSSDNKSEDSRASEPEELVPEPSSREGDSSDPEVLSRMTSSKESNISSSDKEDTSEPELLTQEDEAGHTQSSAQDGEPAPHPQSASLGETSDQGQPLSSEKVLDDVEPSSLDQGQVTPGLSQERASMSARGEDPKTTGQAKNKEEDRTASGSDSGSSDENKDTWDMLSDAAHDSN